MELEWSRSRSVRDDATAVIRLNWQNWHRQKRQFKRNWRIWLVRFVRNRKDSAGYAAITIYVNLTFSTRFNTKTNTNSTFCEYLSTWSRETSPQRRITRALFCILFFFSKIYLKFKLPHFRKRSCFSLRASKRCSEGKRKKKNKEKNKRNTVD